MMNKNIQPIDEITYCSLASLLKQKAQARLLKRGRKNIHAYQSGQHLSVYKGRGMDFTESRLYQSGDDVRLLDWRVTARTGKPHTKVFSEERERPILLIVDLRSPMFFATRGCYKSVLAAKVASLLVWKSLQDGDKAGAMVITASGQLNIHKPSRSQSAASRIINTIAKATLLAPATLSSEDRSVQSLSDTLKQLNPLVETGTHIVMLSDFRGLDKAAVRQLIAVADKSSLTLIAINDPFETEIARYSGLPVTNGEKLLHMDKQAELKYQRLQEARETALEDLTKRDHIHRLTLSTAHTPNEILLTLSQGLQ